LPVVCRPYKTTRADREEILKIVTDWKRCSVVSDYFTICESRAISQANILTQVRWALEPCHSRKLELLCMVWAVNKLRQFLLGINFRELEFL